MLQAIQVPYTHRGTSESGALVGESHSGHVSLALPVAASLGPLSGKLGGPTRSQSQSPSPLVLCPLCKCGIELTELIPEALCSFGQLSFGSCNSVLPGVIECVAMEGLTGTADYHSSVPSRF